MIGLAWAAGTVAILGRARGGSVSERDPVETLPAVKQRPEEVAVALDARDDGRHREVARVEILRELVPAQRTCDRTTRPRPDRVDGDDLLAVAVHLRVDEDAAPPRK